MRPEASLLLHFQPWRVFCLDRRRTDWVFLCLPVLSVCLSLTSSMAIKAIACLFLNLMFIGCSLGELSSPGLTLGTCSMPAFQANPRHGAASQQEGTTFLAQASSPCRAGRLQEESGVSNTKAASIRTLSLTVRRLPCDVLRMQVQTILMLSLIYRPEAAFQGCVVKRAAKHPTLLLWWPRRRTRGSLKSCNLSLRWQICA